MYISCTYFVVYILYIYVYIYIDKGKGTNESFVSREDLISKYNLNPKDIPIKTNFKQKKKQCQFNPEYIFKMNINQRIISIYNKVTSTLQSMV